VPVRRPASPGAEASRTCRRPLSRALSRPDACSHNASCFAHAARARTLPRPRTSGSGRDRLPVGASEHHAEAHLHGGDGHRLHGAHVRPLPCQPRQLSRHPILALGRAVHALVRRAGPATRFGLHRDEARRAQAAVVRHLRAVPHVASGCRCRTLLAREANAANGAADVPRSPRARQRVRSARHAPVAFVAGRHHPGAAARTLHGTPQRMARPGQHGCLRAARPGRRLGAGRREGRCLDGRLRAGVRRRHPGSRHPPDDPGTADAVDPAAGLLALREGTAGRSGLSALACVQRRLDVRHDARRLPQHGAFRSEPGHPPQHAGRVPRAYHAAPDRHDADRPADGEAHRPLRRSADALRRAPPMGYTAGVVAPGKAGERPALARRRGGHRRDRQRDGTHRSAETDHAPAQLGTGVDVRRRLNMHGEPDRRARAPGRRSDTPTAGWTHVVRRAVHPYRIPRGLPDVLRAQDVGDCSDPPRS
jgi:hypothetical protein